MTHSATSQAPTAHFKDEILEYLAESANVAQFVSFSPGTDPALRFARVRGVDPPALRTVEEAVAALVGVAQSVNVRSFHPEQPKSHDFLYGLTDVSVVVAEVMRLAKRGLYTIVNETIDIHDGGISGVVYGGVLEFAPDDTPRCVEKSGTASLPRTEGLRILQTVYGFAPTLDYGPETRVEFSIHPLRRGLRHDHTIIWEVERGEEIELAPAMTWPNRFSRFLGDKVFGLLVAEGIGLPVPFARVVSRRVAPFEFGTPTGTAEHWIRTAPLEQVPGRFTTHRGWIDPFGLMQDEDPAGEKISSVLAQEAVEPAWSGAAASSPDGVVIDGVRGPGDAFMQGREGPQPLPRDVVDAVERTLRQAAGRVGPVRIEWVFDGLRVWVVQLHGSGLPSGGRTIYPGSFRVEHRFDVEAGLEPLRELAEQIKGTGEGIVVVGSVGITSHFGDVLRRARVPSRIEPV